MSLTFKTFSSSSKGNMYLLKGYDEALLIECGVNLNEMTLGLCNEWPNIKGCLISHEHKDHSRLIRYVNRSAIDCYLSRETIENLDIWNHRNIPIKLKADILIGSEWGVRTFELEHDVPNIGFYIYHFPTNQTTLYITDTFYVKYKFSKINNIIIEVNYAKECLNPKNVVKNKRLLTTHFELEDSIDFCKENASEDLKNIVLVHLSNENSDEEMFLRKYNEYFKNVNIHIAENNKVISFL